ncbi:hypothetical protein LCGC14_0483050 [marine sediment metagenome]|uniref:HNH endonuclease n=1 Tax=marine sediment metagenome TaxID=412755 RepID=A0A0F9SS21_9ZZZZ
MTLLFGEAAYNQLYHNNKRSAKLRGHNWNLRKQDFKSLTQMQCYYCGIEPSQIYHNKELNGDYLYNGVDRIDNNLGYIYGNVLPCCKTCNYVKSNQSMREFQAWIDRLVEHQGRQ